MEVSVRDNNVDQALRVLKKKMQREGVFKKMKEEQAFTSKGEKRRIAKAAAVSRSFKTAAKKMAEDEGIPLAEAKKIIRERRNGRSPR